MCGSWRKSEILRYIDMTEYIVHPFEPFFRADSKILIVGSLPSVKSRENGFYYGHPQNRFWKMLAMIFSEETPLLIEEKQRFLEKHKIAVYDSIRECTICGSSDSSISNVIPSDIEKIVSACKITKILANGKTAAKYFLKYQDEKLMFHAENSSFHKSCKCRLFNSKTC